jgi:hypothetical protein
MPRQGLPGRAKPARRKPARHRASVRFAPAQEIICYWSCNGGEYTAGRVCDISANGACLLIRGRLEPDAELAVELINGPHTYLCARKLRVVRVYRGGRNDLVVGGSFDRKLNYDELLPFIL